MSGQSVKVLHGVLHDSMTAPSTTQLTDVRGIKFTTSDGRSFVVSFSGDWEDGIEVTTSTGELRVVPIHQSAIIVRSNHQ